MKTEDRSTVSQGSASFVAIVMDGNARWARSHNVPVLEGHRVGAKALKQTVRASVELGIEELTVYAFSTENWERPSGEVSGLMEMFTELIESETPELDEQGVRLRFVGRRRNLDKKLIEQMDWAQKQTLDNARMDLFIAFNYGGRGEILDAARKFSSETEPSSDDGEMESSFRKYLYAPDMHEPDLLIRTSGEMRLSNFLLWQCAYSELYFTNVLWPDFGKDDLIKALDEYRSRMRRFGARDETG